MTGSASPSRFDGRTRLQAGPAAPPLCRRPASAELHPVIHAYAPYSDSCNPGKSWLACLLPLKRASSLSDTAQILAVPRFALPFYR